VTAAVTLMTFDNAVELPSNRSRAIVVSTVLSEHNDSNNGLLRSGSKNVHGRIINHNVQRFRIGHEVGQSIS